MKATFPMPATVQRAHMRSQYDCSNTEMLQWAPCDQGIACTALLQVT